MPRVVGKGKITGTSIHSRYVYLQLEINGKGLHNPVFSSLMYVDR